jgi:hypothetical protein
MNVVVVLYLALLFFVLVPNVVLRLPPNGGKFTVAAVHALVFAVVVFFTKDFVWRWSTSIGL